jgi:acetylserotonin N-methyltransferase
MTMPEGPAYIRSLSRGYRRSQVLFAGVHLGVFELLARGELSAREAAEKLSLSVRGTEILLNALAGLGLLVKTQGRFAVKETLAEFLTQGGRQSMVGAIRHHANLMRCWDELEQCVRTGRACSYQAKTPDELAQRRADFMWAMKDNARPAAGEIFEKGEFSSSQRLLDVGCGPATFSIEFARRNPSLQVMLVDIREIITIAMKEVSDAGLTPQFATMACDFTVTPLGIGQYDTAFVSQVIHMYDAEASQSLLKKVRQALAAGGRVVLHDSFVSDEGVAPIETALFAVNMLVGTCGGRCYSSREVFGWLMNVGFENPGLVPLRGDTSLIVAVKKG